MRIRNHGEKIILRGFRVMLFRMVPKRSGIYRKLGISFRVMLFRMVPKLQVFLLPLPNRFRVMLFRMVPKQNHLNYL